MLWRNKSHNEIQKNPKQTATTAKNQITIETSAVNLNERKTKPKTNIAGNDINNGGQTNLISNNKTPNNTKTNNTNNQTDRKPRHVYPPCETGGKTNQSTEKCYFRANAANRPPARIRRLEGQNPVQQRNSQCNSD